MLSSSHKSVFPTLGISHNYSNMVDWWTPKGQATISHLDPRRAPITFPYIIFPTPSNTSSIQHQGNFGLIFFFLTCTVFPQRSLRTIQWLLSILDLWGPLSLFSPSFSHMVLLNSYLKQETIFHFLEHVMFTNTGDIVPIPLQLIHFQIASNYHPSPHALDKCESHIITSQYRSYFHCNNWYDDLSIF